MFLLAQFREKRAYPLIVNLFSHLGDTSDNIAGDFVCEDLHRVLASVCHGDTTLIKQLIENRDADEYVRGAGLRALLVLVVNGKKTREETWITTKVSLGKTRKRAFNGLEWSHIMLL